MAAQEFPLTDGIRLSSGSEVRIRGQGAKGFHDWLESPQCISSSLEQLSVLSLNLTCWSDGFTNRWLSAREGHLQNRKPVPQGDVWHCGHDPLSRSRFKCCMQTSGLVTSCTSPLPGSLRKLGATGRRLTHWDVQCVLNYKTDTV